jgi:Zn-dependent M28 family amino/carboxypeptidase
MQLDMGEESAERAPLQGWVTTETAVKLFDLAEEDQVALMEGALSPDFEPVPLGLKISATMNNTFERGVTHNVVGIIEGSERPEEYIVYTSHWDHLGMDGDEIYNGAVDNATGVAVLLEIARVVKQMPEAPARSLVFLFVGAEEHGLLGSEYYANNPIYPTHQTVANLNVDGIYPFGPTNDIIVIGHNQSKLLDWAERIAEKQDRYVIPDQEPEKGFFYRSDQFSFAKVGVPAVYAGGGADLVDGGLDKGQELRQDYNRKYYHKPGDEYNADTWDLGGVAQDGEFFLMLGLELANSEEWPEWNETSEFRAIRMADLNRN